MKTNTYIEASNNKYRVPRSVCKVLLKRKMKFKMASPNHHLDGKKEMLSRGKAFF